MNQPTEIVTLATLAGGAAIERFHDALRDVLDNIADPNTDAEKARKITLTITIVPDEDRSMASVKIEAATKVPGRTAVVTKVYTLKHAGENIAVEYDPKQAKLFADLPSNVVSHGGPKPV